MTKLTLFHSFNMSQSVKLKCVNIFFCYISSFSVFFVIFPFFRYFLLYFLFICFLLYFFFFAINCYISSFSVFFVIFHLLCGIFCYISSFSVFFSFQKLLTNAIHGLNFRNVVYIKILKLEISYKNYDQLTN